MKIILCVSLAFISFGCAHSAYIPNTPHQAPVVAKKRWGGQIGFDYSSAAEVPLFADTTSNPPVKAQGNIGSIGGAGSSIVAALGIFEPVDIYLTHGFGLRWQFLGVDDGSDWKATVFAGGMNGRSSETSSQAGGQTYKTTTRLSGSEFGASVGYQSNEDLLLYSTLFQRRGKGQTEIVQPGITFAYDNDFQLTGLVFGLQFGQDWYFTAEVGSSAVGWGGGPSGDAFASTIGFGYKW